MCLLLLLPLSPLGPETRGRAGLAGRWALDCITGMETFLAVVASPPRHAPAAAKASQGRSSEEEEAATAAVARLCRSWNARTGTSHPPLAPRGGPDPTPQPAQRQARGLTRFVIR